MNGRVLIDRLTQSERLNFLLTNRIPRRLATHVVGWLGQVEHPIVRIPSLAIWKLFAGDLHLDEARKTAFTSVQDCFTRQLKPGARPIVSDPDVLVSP